MASFGEKLDSAAGQATCAALAIGGARLIGSGAVALAAGGAGVVPLTAGSLALMAAAYGCRWDPNQGDPQPPSSDIPCFEGVSTFQINQLVDGAFVGGSTPEIKKIIKVEALAEQPCGSGGSRQPQKIFWEQADGSTGDTTLLTGGPCGSVSEYTLQQVWSGDDTCITPGDEPGLPEIPTFEYTDPDDGCSLTVNIKGFQQDPNGAINPVFKIEPSPSLRSDGGVIGGCNFSPVFYTGGPSGGGGPPNYRPWNPDWDDDPGLSPWRDFLNDLAGSLISNLLYDGLKQLYETPLGPAKYTLLAPCQIDEEGNRLKVEVEIPQLPQTLGLATRIEALMPILQGQKDFKQPLCPPEPIPLEGDFRTIHFLSQEISPNGKSCLRKRLRYRSQSGVGLNDLIDYWKDFQFDAGPVIVKHRGASWGTITVWAASSDEGKRIIRHAAGEAAIDADSVGRWEISGSSSSRLGMSGTMRVNRTGGYYWITARDGSDSRPIVGTT
jgi:hypothetical protein